MSGLLQIRDVPDETRQALKARAAIAGLSLNSFLLGVLTREVDRPTVAEVLARAAARSEQLHGSAAGVIRDERAARDRDLSARRPRR